MPTEGPESKEEVEEEEEKWDEGKDDEEGECHEDGQGHEDGEEHNNPPPEQLLEAVHAMEDMLLDDIMPADIYLGDAYIEEEAKDDDVPPGLRLFRSIRRCCKDVR